MTIDEAVQKCIEEKQTEGLRTFYLNGLFGPIPCGIPKRSCCFCSKCTDLWWDYTHGPYMFDCTEDRDTEFGCIGQCEYYEDNGTPYEKWISEKGEND